MERETVVFGHKQGEPDYTEVVLLTHAEKRTDLPAMLELMRRDGWVTRIAYFGDEAPDFTRVFNK